jgi:hypothetical protein
MVLAPAMAINAESQGKKGIAREQIAIWGYFCVMLASILIGH